MRRKLVVDLRSRVRAFRLPDAVAAAITAATPADWATHVVQADTDSAGDGSRPPSDESLAAIADAEVYVGFGMSKALFAAAQQLRWVHTATAGVTAMLFPELVAHEVVVTNSAGGVYAPAIAEHVLGGILHFLRAFDVAGQQQRGAHWDTAPFGGDAAMVRELAECHAVVVGAGGIGSAVATRLGLLGARVTAVRRDPAKGAPAGCTAVVGQNQFASVLTTADIVVLAAPLTGETRALLTAERIAILPRGAIVCNVSRGALVDEAALTAALREGRIRGAVLDVFAQEPLAASSELWQLPNVLHTPHVSGVSPRLVWVRLQELFLDNWQRWRNGVPLRNVVNKQSGY